MQTEFDELVASHAGDEFQILDPGQRAEEDLFTGEPEIDQQVELAQHVESLLRVAGEWTHSTCKTTWTLVTGLVNASLSGLRSYAKKYQEERSTSLWEDLALNVFANSLSDFLIAFFGILIGVMLGRRAKKSAPVTE